MDAKISVFVICIEAIIYLLYNMHEYTFNNDHYLPMYSWMLSVSPTQPCH